MGTGGVGTGEVRDLVLRGNIIINHDDPSQPLRARRTAGDRLLRRHVRRLDGREQRRHHRSLARHQPLRRGRLEHRQQHRDRQRRRRARAALDHDELEPGHAVVRTSWCATTWRPTTRSPAPRSSPTTTSSSRTPPRSSSRRRSTSACSPARPPRTPAARTGAPPFDLLRVPRPQGAAFDLGAYERCPLCLFLDGFETGGASVWSGIAP